MADANQIKPLLENIKQVRSMEREKLLRPSLGVESLEKDLTPLLERLDNFMQFIERYAADVHVNYLQQVNNTIIAISNILKGQANRQSASDYISQKPQFLATLNQQLSQIEQYFPFFVTAAVVKEGLLRDKEIRDKEINQHLSRLEENIEKQQERYQKTVDAQTQAVIAEAKKISDQMAENVKKMVDEKIATAQHVAEQIEKSARRTAQKVSVKAAQDQFGNVQKKLNFQIGLWAVLSATSFVAFVLLANHFLSSTPPEQTIAQTVYHTALRITILSATGGITVYFMRIFRAHLHMYQYNQHRQAVTNSIEAFVAAAETSEQRDVILASLVNAVVSFGQSGLIQNEPDNIHPAQMIIDTAPRVLSSAAQKPAS